MSSTTKVCYRCNTAKEFSKFNLDHRYDPPRPRNLCVQCCVDANKKYRHSNSEAYNKSAREKRLERKKRAIIYKGGVCEMCKESFHPAAMDFHHINPTEKDKDPGLMMSSSDENLFKELDKCILLCANCHRIHHFEN